MIRFRTDWEFAQGRMRLAECGSSIVVSGLFIRWAARGPIGAEIALNDEACANGQIITTRGEIASPRICWMSKSMDER